MNIIIKSVSPPRRPGTLAHVAVEIELEGHRIAISDVRVLANRAGVLWVGMPSITVFDEGRRYHYETALELSRELHRAVEDAVLAEYERWSRQEAKVQPEQPQTLGMRARKELGGGAK